MFFFWFAVPVGSQEDRVWYIIITVRGGLQILADGFVRVKHSIPTHGDDELQRNIELQGFTETTKNSTLLHVII